MVSGRVENRGLIIGSNHGKDCQANKRTQSREIDAKNETAPPSPVAVHLGIYPVKSEQHQFTDRGQIEMSRHRNSLERGYWRPLRMFRC
jgi:hypothetical protein